MNESALKEVIKSKLVKSAQLDQSTGQQIDPRMLQYLMMQQQADPRQLMAQQMEEQRMARLQAIANASQEAGYAPQEDGLPSSGAVTNQSIGRGIASTGVGGLMGAGAGGALGALMKRPGKGMAIGGLLGAGMGLGAGIGAGVSDQNRLSEMRRDTNISKALSLAAQRRLMEGGM